MLTKVNSVNHEVLKLCRKNVCLTIEDVRQKTGLPTKYLKLLELGIDKPTYIEMDKLAECYLVPRWVFTLDHLPPEIQVEAIEEYVRIKNGTKQRETTCPTCGGSGTIPR